MPQKSKPKATSKKARTNRHVPSEPRASVVVTVGWMLGALATFGAECGGLAVMALAWSIESMPAWLKTMSHVAFLVALVSGLFTLIMTPVCLKVRPTPPPSSILRLVVVVAVMPLLVLIARATFGY